MAKKSNKKTNIDDTDVSVPAAADSDNGEVIDKTDGSGVSGALAVSADNVPAPCTASSDEVAPKRCEFPEAERRIEYSDDDQRMGGGYASVNDGELAGNEYARVAAPRNDTRAADNGILWITVIIMSVLCVIIAVCSSLLTAHFMRSGEKAPIINSGDIQQNISAVVKSRKSCVAEISCGTLRGSCIITKREGKTVYAITNAHVLREYIDFGHLPSIRFYGEDGFYSARVAGYDLYYDVAVVMIDHETRYAVYNLDGDDSVFSPDIEYADGDYVVSIGNAMGYGIAAYDGIISRSSELLECDELFNTGNKKFVPVMRTTAVINAGMSGGAVFDMSGRLVGLGTYRLSNTVGVDNEGSASTDVEDTGFATPISVLYSVYKRILNDANGGEVGLMYLRPKKSDTSSIGRLGLPFGFTCEYRNGSLTVVSLDAAMPNTNVAEGDIITHINGKKLVSDDRAETGKPELSDICEVIGELLKYNLGAPGDVLMFTVSRGGNEFNFTVDNYRYAI